MAAPAFVVKVTATSAGGGHTEGTASQPPSWINATSALDRKYLTLTGYCSRTSEKGGGSSGAHTPPRPFSRFIGCGERKRRGLRERARIALF